MQESKNFCTNYLTKFSIDLNGMCFTVETCWCDEPQSFYLVHSIFKVENPIYVISSKKQKQKTWSFDLYSDIYRLISFKFSMAIETTKLYILILVWMTLTFSQGHSCRRNWKCQHPFSCSLSIILKVWGFLHKCHSRERTLLMWFYEI